MAALKRYDARFHRLTFKLLQTCTVFVPNSVLKRQHTGYQAFILCMSCMRYCHSWGFVPRCSQRGSGRQRWFTRYALFISMSSYEMSPVTAVQIQSAHLAKSPLATPVLWTMHQEITHVDLVQPGIHEYTPCSKCQNYRMCTTRVYTSQLVSLSTLLLCHFKHHVD